MANKITRNIRKLIDKIVPSKSESKETVSTPPYLNEANLSNLDVRFLPAQLISSAWSSSKTIPEIKASSNVKKQLKEVKALEDHLKKTYGSDFHNIGWHGTSSLQRLLWQDDKFLTAMSNPDFVKALMLNAKNKNEGVLGKIGTSELTLSGIVLSSLGSNRLSYLATAAPNWINKPKIDGVKWDTLKEMMAPISNAETPHQASPEYLTKLHNALSSTQNVLQELQGKTPTPVISAERTATNIFIQTASSAELVTVINTRSTMILGPAC